MIAKWKRDFKKNMKIGAIFMDLSKAFDTINHRLLLAKLKAYGLQATALKLMENYLTGRYQRTKVNGEYGRIKGSILGPLLFTIFFNNLFLCSYAQK